MNVVNFRRVAILTGLTLLPAAAFAAATGADGGLFASICGALCGSCACG